MIRYGFHPEARLEFHESAKYYESQQVGLGRRFIDAVQDAVQRIIYGDRSHCALSGEGGRSAATGAYVKYVRIASTA